MAADTESSGSDSAAGPVEYHEVLRSPTTSSEESRSTRSRLDWMTTLSPAKRSCINLHVTESCVNKATANLEALKDMITARKFKHLDSSSKSTPLNTLSTDSFRGLRTPSPVKVRISTESTEGLSVEGFKTGTMVDRLSMSLLRKPGTMNANAIISSILNLLGRLELDRQDTQNTLTQQEVLSQDLREDLGRENERKQELLLQSVQGEHEAIAKEIRELKWRANFRGRKLRRALESEAYLAKKNNGFKREVKRLTELNPLLLEKVKLEESKIKNIIRMLQEVREDVEYMEKDIREVEDQRAKILLLSSSQTDKTKEKKESLSAVLDTEISQLESLKQEANDSSKKIKDLDTKYIAENMKIKNLEAEIFQADLRADRLKSKVSKLESERRRLMDEKRKLHERKKEIKKSNELELRKLERGYAALEEKLHAEDKEVVASKREKTELENDIETMKETIVLTRLKGADIEKSITRAYREIERLDQQLQVSLLEYNHATRSHRRIKEEYKLEKAKADDAEDTLRDRIKFLKKKIREEKKTQILYENKTKAQTATMLQLMAEYEKQENKVLEMVQEVEETVDTKTVKVEELQTTKEEHTELLERTESEMARAVDELAALEKDLGGKKTELTKQERQLKEEVVEKVQLVEATTEKIKDLEGKLEDKEKTIRTMLKLKTGVLESLEKLKSELSEMEGKLKAERKREQSWKDEYKEIYDFSTDADGKHASYLKDRQTLLKQQTLDLEKSLESNTELALSYHQLQCEFIRVKTDAMRVIHRKLELETTLRDHQQLLAFQSGVYSALEAHYQSRGEKYQSDLAQCRSRSLSNTEQLQSLKHRLESMVGMLMGFLEHQKQISESEDFDSDTYSSM